MSANWSRSISSWRMDADSESTYTTQEKCLQQNTLEDLESRVQGPWKRSWNKALSTSTEFCFCLFVKANNSVKIMLR